MVLTTKKQVQKKYPNGIDLLEIGSVEHPEAGYVHLDIQLDLPDLDIAGDVRNMPIPDNWVSGHVRAVHITEHFCHQEYSGKPQRDAYGTIPEVLSEIYRVLKPGGEVLIVTPDFNKITQSAAFHRLPRYWAQRWSVGGHLNEYDVHHWLWTYKDGKEFLEDAGFVGVSDWNPVQSDKEVFKLNLLPPVPGDSNWHRFEWYHWLFIKATKPL